MDEWMDCWVGVWREREMNKNMFPLLIGSLYFFNTEGQTRSLLSDFAKVLVPFAKKMSQAISHCLKHIYLLSVDGGRIKFYLSCLKDYRNSFVFFRQKYSREKEFFFLFHVVGIK